MIFFTNNQNVVKKETMEVGKNVIQQMGGGNYLGDMRDKFITEISWKI